MDAEIKSVISSELESGERILWMGIPKQGIMLRSVDIFLIPFSFMWGGFAITWFIGATRAGGAFGLFGIPFVLIGLYLMIGRFFVDAWQRAKTFYALTDQRVIIVSGLINRYVKSLNMRTLPEITLSEKNDGRGSIVFGTSNNRVAMYAGTGWPGADQFGPPQFDMVKNARTIYRQIRQTQKDLEDR